MASCARARSGMSGVRLTLAVIGPAQDKLVAAMGAGAPTLLVPILEREADVHAALAADALMPSSGHAPEPSVLGPMPPPCSAGSTRPSTGVITPSRCGRETISSLRSFA
ncbi:hypothetical protein GCM10017691_12850 [Pseudonocardia petroleophila]